MELLQVIGPLTDPTAYGGRAEDAFDLVLPSMPGYGFSGKPQSTGGGPDRIARTWAELMERLGYKRYVAQGGDWGSVVADVMARQAPAGLLGIHVNMPATVPADVAKALNSGDPAHRGCPIRKRPRSNLWRPSTKGKDTLNEPRTRAPICRCSHACRRGQFRSDLQRRGGSRELRARAGRAARFAASTTILVIIFVTAVASEAALRPRVSMQSHGDNQNFLAHARHVRHTCARCYGSSHVRGKEEGRCFQTEDTSQMRTRPGRSM